MPTIFLDCEFTVDGADSTKFESTDSLLDYDLVVWDPEVTFDEISFSSGKYLGRPSLSAGQSTVMLAALQRRRKEIVSMLELGRTVIVLGSGHKSFYVDTGNREYSGTGRNRQTTNILSSRDLWSAIPFDIKLEEGRGRNLEPAGDAVHELWSVSRERWSYRAIVDLPDSEPIFRVRGTDKVVAAYHRNAKGGLLVIIPEPDIDDQETAEDAFEAMLRWTRSLDVDADFEAPEWLTKVRTSQESSRLVELDGARERMNAERRAVAALEVALRTEAQWKRLFAASGAALERQVALAFEVLGFTILPSTPGRGDIRLQLSSEIAVVEVKGVSKSAAEKNAAQLEKWVASELENDVAAKAILVVNGWRNVPVGLRTEGVFPNQMLQYSEARGHCLLSGFQLFYMCMKVLETPQSAGTYARLVLDTVGVVPGMNDVREVLELDQD